MRDFCSDTKARLHVECCLRARVTRSLQRLGSADSELQPPGTHCSNAALKIAQLTLISDIKQMCLASVLCHDDSIQTWVRKSHVTKCAWGAVTHVDLHVLIRSYKKSFINNLNSICILASQIKNVNHFCSLKWFTERLHQKTKPPAQFMTWD